MAATRRPSVPVMQLYAGTLTTFDEPTYDSQPCHTQHPSAIAAHSNANLNHSMVFNPPSLDTTITSPNKSSHTLSSPLRNIATADFSAISFPAPEQVSYTDSPKKEALHARMPSSGARMPPKAAFHTFSSTQSISKEDSYVNPALFNDLAAFQQNMNVWYDGPKKRPLMEAAPLRDRSANIPTGKRQKLDDEDSFILPDPSQMPHVEDDGGKPPYSYAQLIGMAILRAPNRRLTLAQIYKWISDTFKHYVMAESGWQNSIRHNLSLNKAFHKQERPKDDPGKGNYWAIVPGMERQFLKDKTNRRGNNCNEGVLHVHQHDVNAISRPSTAPAFGPFPRAPLFTAKKYDAKAIDSSKFPEEPDLSSDATLPPSDPLQEEITDLTRMPPPSAPPMQSSPPAAELRSSPPAPMNHHTGREDDTPPPIPRFPSTSRSGGRKRKFASMNDSGYFSSIESSAVRAPDVHLPLTSEADLAQPRRKRGRAEEEIARIRGSSFDPSPSKSRHLSKQTATDLVSSSPVIDENMLRPPPAITPAVMFKRPARPIATVSPNANLRNHRDRVRAMIGSPAHGLSPLPDSNLWSPAFCLPEEDYPQSNTRSGSLLGATNPLINVDLFDENTSAFLTARGSPEKRSAKRPGLMRSSTDVGSVLQEVKGNAKMNSMSLAESGLTPFKLEPIGLRSPVRFAGESPLKKMTSVDDIHKDVFSLDFNDENQMPLKYDEFLGIEFGSEGSEEGLDILQGFQKIGSNANPFGNPRSASKARPALGRSMTNLF